MRSVFAPLQGRRQLKRVSGPQVVSIYKLYRRRPQSVRRLNHGPRIGKALGEFTGFGPVGGVELLHPHKPGQRARNLDRRRPPDDGVIKSSPALCASQESILVCLTNFRFRPMPMPPKLNRKRALFVLTKIDEILAWEKQKEMERDTRFVDLGRYLCEVRAGQYWRLENLKSFDELLTRRFPESRRKAYYLMSIHEHLPPQARKDLKEVGWTKGLELAKLARRDGQHFDCATWLHRAREMPKEDFRREVEKELTGKETEPSELIYFKVYKSQIPVIEQAIETAGLMLGTDKSRGYCLEMICADFLAGAHLDDGNPEILLNSISRYYKFLPGEQQQAFLVNLLEKAS